MMRLVATLLVTLAGHAVGGHWQRWVAQAHVPTPAVRVVLASSRICDIPGVQASQACSGGPDPYELAAYDRWSLYFELGHIYDMATLTSVERARLARLWGQPHARWDDSTAELDRGREDGLTVDFAAAYATCAVGRAPTGLQCGDAPPITMRNTCAVIRRAATR
jgi:hypothetical protein